MRKITIFTLKERAEPNYLRLYFESRPEVHELVHWWAGHHYGDGECGEMWSPSSF